MRMASLDAEKDVRMSFGEFDCGCDNRREIMGASSWQIDAGIVAVVALLVVAVLWIAR